MTTWQVRAMIENEVLIFFIIIILKYIIISDLERK